MVEKAVAEVIAACQLGARANATCLEGKVFSLYNSYASCVAGAGQNSTAINQCLFTTMDASEAGITSCITDPKPEDISCVQSEASEKLLQFLSTLT